MKRQESSIIETHSQATCKDCGKPLIQSARKTPHPREFCDTTCRQRYHRKQKAQTRAIIVTPKYVTMNEQDYQVRIAALEQVVQTLQARLNLEERLRTDIEVRHFKNWLRRHPQPEDTDFAKRVLADTRLPLHASRSLYEARLRLYKYSEEDLALFRDVWKTILLSQP